MEDTIGVRLHLQPATGYGAALCRWLRTSSRRYHRPIGQIHRAERTHDWIKLGGKVISAIQISCSARLAFGCWLFGNLASTFAVLCTQQRCSRVFGQTSPAAFQNPSAPSAMASRGGT